MILFTRTSSCRLMFNATVLTLMVLVLVLVQAKTSVAETSAENKLPGEVVHGLAYLIERVQDRETVDMEQIHALLDFAGKVALERDDWDVESLHNATGGYFGYTINTPADRIVQYLYHPDLPPSIFHPSVVRLGKWDDRPKEDIPRLWQELQENDLVAVHGQEMEENTPDVNTGGYYTYFNDRMILLVNHAGEKYVLSVSKQKDQSTVGRKGVVIGDDTDWNYFYADDEGLTKGGLGWVNSYMFDSFSVTVLTADTVNRNQSRHVMFKWVRAGWSGMNMVRSTHVREGCRRFSQSLIRLMESERLPDIETLEAMSRHVRSMDAAQLRQSLEPYIENLRRISKDDSILSRRSFRSILSQDDPLEHYSTYAKQSLVMKEFLKTSIGIPALMTMSQDDVLVSFLR